MTETMPGAWTEYSNSITPEAKKVFEKAFENWVGARFEAVAFATQVVSGINYSFFCNTENSVRYPTTYPTLVRIYQSVDGVIHHPEIVDLSQDR